MHDEPPVKLARRGTSSSRFVAARVYIDAHITRCVVAYIYMYVPTLPSRRDSYWPSGDVGMHLYPQRICIYSCRVRQTYHIPPYHRAVSHSGGVFYTRNKGRVDFLRVRAAQRVYFVPSCLMLTQGAKLCCALTLGCSRLDCARDNHRGCTAVDIRTANFGS